MNATSHRDRVERHKQARKTAIGLSVGIVVLTLVVSVVIVKPGRPDRITLLTGPEGSAYHQLGQRYAEELRSRGLEVDVIVTDGGLDNLHRLVSSDGDLAVAFAPSSIERTAGDDLDTSRLVALGTVAFEPFWLFYRVELGIETIEDLAGRVVLTGGGGAVSDHMIREMVALNELTDKVVFRAADDETPTAVVELLETGSVDAVVVSGSPRSAFVAALLKADAVTFLSVKRAAAYTARSPGITTLVAPEGVFDLARNRPPHDAQLLSAATTLIALEDLDAAIAPAVLDVASEIHDEPTVFADQGTFPSAEHVSLPLKSSAKRYFQQGKTGLSKYLPYGVTRLLNRIGFFVLPALAVALLLIKTTPMALRVWCNLRLTGLFKRLEVVEKAQAAGADRKELLAILDKVDRDSAGMFVSRSVLHDYIDFRQFLHDMRERVADRGSEQAR